MSLKNSSALERLQESDLRPEDEASESEDSQPDQQDVDEGEMDGSKTAPDQPHGDQEGQVANDVARARRRRQTARARQGNYQSKEYQIKQPHGDVAGSPSGGSDSDHKGSTTSMKRRGKSRSRKTRHRKRRRKRARQDDAEPGELSSTDRDVEGDNPEEEGHSGEPYGSYGEVGGTDTHGDHGEVGDQPGEGNPPDTDPGSEKKSTAEQTTSGAVGHGARDEMNQRANMDREHMDRRRKGRYQDEDEEEEDDEGEMSMAEQIRQARQRRGA